MSTLVWSAASGTVLLWLFAAIVIQGCKLLARDVPELARTVFHELRPFILTAVLVQFVSRLIIDGEATFWTGFNLGIGLWNWWFLRDIDDDDRWKRRRKRLAEKVSVAGGRLTVVPAGAR